MKQLVSEYKLSLKALDKRISELKIIERELSLQQYSPQRESELEELKERLKPLNCMMNDLKTVIKEMGEKKAVEIAEDLNISRQAVHKTLRQARKKLEKTKIFLEM